MQFTAMLRYDPSDPFSGEMFGRLYRRGIKVQGVPTVIQGGEMQHCYLEAPDVVPIHMICAVLDAEVGSDLLGVTIGEQ